jgi:hypothetical protein
MQPGDRCSHQDGEGIVIAAIASFDELDLHVATDATRFKGPRSHNTGPPCGGFGSVGFPDNGAMSEVDVARTGPDRLRVAIGRGPRRSRPDAGDLGDPR